jgi:ribose transport system permease protein
LSGRWDCADFGRDDLPIGRYLYAIGSYERAAELIGIPITRYVIGSFVASGVVTAIAGIVLGAKLQVGQSNIGPEYLLPAFVGALLGSTSVRPGRVNVWGTIIAVLILAVGISGIQQLGASFFIEPLFNGLTLIVAVGLAGYFARRRLRVAVALPEPLLPSPGETPSSPAPPQGVLAP